VHRFPLHLLLLLAAALAAGAGCGGKLPPYATTSKCGRNGCDAMSCPSGTHCELGSSDCVPRCALDYPNK
jgi:hypothetical protein